MTYKELQSLQHDLHDARDDRDHTRDELMELENEMNVLKEEERNLSMKISDDHIVADEQDIFIGELFPNIQAGYVLTMFNLQDFETMKFDFIMNALKSLKPPHRAVFMRYDYKLDPFTMLWHPVEEMRERARTYSP